jgi:polysaccharide export outer membrane protein
MSVIRILLMSAIMALAFGLQAYGQTQDYVLGEGDLLKITVYENEDLTTHARISGDGMVNVPLVGMTKLAGMTAGEAERKLTALFADGYIINPHVSVFVEEYRSKRVTILGEVVKPGVYELNGNATILEIVSKAGGLTDKAGNNLIIKRKPAASGPSAPKGSADGDNYININLKDLMEKGNMSDNLYVQDGDDIFVTKSGFIYVTGEVRKPGAYKYEDGTTVMKAIALAEGLTDKAAPGRTVLIRKEDGKEKKIKVDMGAAVLPDDVISVPESFF